MLLLEEFPHFSLTYSAAHACLYANWQQGHNGELTRANYALILQHVRATQSTKLLNDTTLAGNGWQEISGWLTEDWFKQLAKEGIQSVAWVLPRDPQAFCSTYQLLKQMRQLLVDTFTDAEVACRWLQCSAVSGPKMPIAQL